MMKIIRTLFLLLIAVYGSSVVAKPMLKATFSSTTLYYGIGPSTFDRSILLNVMVDTHDGVYYGTWQLGGVFKNRPVPLQSWSGPEPAPTVVLRDFDNSVARSSCQNMPASWHDCGSFTVDITVQSDDYGCPGWQRVVSLLLMVSLAKRIPRRIRAVQFARKFPLILLISPGCERFETENNPHA